VLAVLLALGLVAAACGDSGSSGSEGDASGGGQTTTTKAPQTGGMLTFASYSEIFGLDPIVALGNGTSGGIEMATIYDTIMRYNPETRKYENRTADSVSANADSTEWTVKLKPGIKFSDGTDYDAAAVQFGMNRHRSGLPGGPTAAECAQYVACPRNTASSGVYMTLVKDIQVVDPLTLKFVLTEPWTSFPYALSAEAGMIPSPTALKKCDGTKNPNTCEFNLKPVGAGPFMIESFKPKDSITVVRNPTYYGPKPYLDGVKFVTFGDTGGSKTYDALKAGNVDAAYLRIPDTVAQAKADGIKGLSSIDQGGEILLLNEGVNVNCSGQKPEPVCVGKPDGPTATNPATKNLKVRQAVAAAYDPKAFNDRVYNGKGLAGTETFQKSFAWDPGVPGYKYDPEQAKKLVNEAKAEGWDGTIRVLFQNTPSGQAGGLAVETMLKSVGMNVALDVSRDSTGQQSLVTTAKDFDISTWGLSLGSDDSAIWAIAQNLSASSPSNRPGFKSQKVDDALKALRSAKTDDEKRAQYKIIAEEINAQIPWIPRVAIETLRAYRPNIHGLSGGLKNFVFFDQAWMER
jgi:peptide/nickel transport system substrate-binding protein